MTTRVDISGRRFGKLLVMNEHKVIKGRMHWLCRCDCGNKKFICSKYMRDGDTNSCGCLVRMEFGEATRNRILHQYKRNAKTRDVEFLLSKKQFLLLTSQDCFYCGESPSNIYKSKWNNGDFIYSGIDRIDNNLGYIVKNCVACCKICNVAKNNLPQHIFLRWAKNVCNNLTCKGLI